MSWQAYVDTQLVATGHVAEACMLGATDGAVWGMTPEFQPRYYEADTSDDQGNPTKITVNEVVFLTGKAAPSSTKAYLPSLCSSAVIE